MNLENVWCRLTARWSRSGKKAVGAFVGVHSSAPREATPVKITGILAMLPQQLGSDVAALAHATVHDDLPDGHLVKTLAKLINRDV